MNEGRKRKEKNEKTKPEAHCKTPKCKTKAQHIFHLAMMSLVYLNGNKTYYKASEKPFTKTAKCTITPL